MKKKKLKTEIENYEGKRLLEENAELQGKYQHTTLDTLIRQDVEHGTFSSRNIYDKEYLTPMFYKYAKRLEKEVEFLRAELNSLKEELNKLIESEESQERGKCIY